MKTFFTRLLLFAFVVRPLSLSAQWNYDNQGVIYSTGSSVGIGMGSANPNANLQVGSGTENGLVSLGGFSFLGSLRSSGDFFAGANVYAQYSTSAENSKIKVYGSSAYGFSAMQMSYNGDINFYVKSGGVTANAQANLPAYNALKISGSGNVGIGTSNPQGYLHVNPIRPVIIKNNGGEAIYGSEIGFNSVLITNPSPAQFKKLGGTSQRGGANIAVDYDGNMLFQMYSGETESESITPYNPQVIFKNNGNVGFGTSNPDAKLTVKGNVHAQEVRVDLSGSIAPDYVFKEGFELTPLDTLERYIKTHNHLPEISSAAEMQKNGLLLKEMNLLLLKKVEELTLHLIEENKINQKQGLQIELLQAELKLSNASK